MQIINNNNTTFSGNLRIIKWNQFKPVTYKYETTEVEDKLIRKVVEPFIDTYQYLDLPMRQSRFINQLIEYITGVKMPPCKCKKAIYDGGDTLYIKDSAYKLTNGTEIELEL